MELRVALPALIEHENARCQPMEGDRLTSALTETLALCGGNLQQSDRITWQLAFASNVQDIPADLLLEALRESRGKCRFADEILPFVREYVGDYPARRRARLASIIQLADVAGVEID